MKRSIFSVGAAALTILLTATGCPPNSGSTTTIPTREAARAADANRDSSGADGRVEVTEPAWGRAGQDDDDRLTSGDLDPDVISRDIDPAQYLSTVYFEFDRAELGADARATIQENADWLRSDLGAVWDVVIEGHCDDRGTIEYNLALGERRAKAIRDYMASLGVARDRMRVVSYGEELPAVPGSGEMAWSRNRRGEFVAER